MFCDQRVLHFAALCFHLALLLWRILSNLVSDNIPDEIVARLFVKVGRNSCPNLGRHVGNVCDRKLEIISITTHSRFVLFLFDWFSCRWWYPSTLSTNFSRLKILDLRFGWFCVLRIFLKISNLTWRWLIYVDISISWWWYCWDALEPSARTLRRPGFWLRPQEFGESTLAAVPFCSINVLRTETSAWGFDVQKHQGESTGHECFFYHENEVCLKMLGIFPMK